MPRAAVTCLVFLTLTFVALTLAKSSQAPGTEEEAAEVPPARVKRGGWWFRRRFTPCVCFRAPCPCDSGFPRALPLPRDLPYQPLPLPLLDDLQEDEPSYQPIPLPLPPPGDPQEDDPMYQPIPLPHPPPGDPQEDDPMYQPLPLPLPDDPLDP
ncbi:uncharacterized protein LOC143288390 [Babylonia areolata]|uniref:uncharacterized protein LOC143288390 n=1 Tax=Babylonia areolata TaxID=304850 RepID=UPI003FD0ACE7